MTTTVPLTAAAATLETRLIQDEREPFREKLKQALEDGWVYGKWGNFKARFLTERDGRLVELIALQLERWRGFSGVPTRIFHEGPGGRWSERAESPVQQAVKEHT